MFFLFSYTLYYNYRDYRSFSIALKTYLTSKESAVYSNNFTSEKWTRFKVPYRFAKTSVGGCFKWFPFSSPKMVLCTLSEFDTTVIGCNIPMVRYLFLLCYCFHSRLFQWGHFPWQTYCPFSSINFYCQCLSCIQCKVCANILTLSISLVAIGYVCCCLQIGTIEISNIYTWFM